MTEQSVAVPRQAALTVRMSDKIEKLAPALIAAQAEFKVAVKSEENPYFKSKYASHQALMDATKEALTKNGLTVIQPVCNDSGVPLLTTMLLHTSGQWIAGDYPVITVKQDPQALGSAITYARRYCYASLLNVQADEDDDANKASGREPGRAKEQENQETGPVVYTGQDALKRKLGAWMKEAKLSKEQMVEINRVLMNKPWNETEAMDYIMAAKNFTAQVQAG